MEQMMFKSCITCEMCKYGRDLGANDWGCRNKERAKAKEKLVHKNDFSCVYAEIKEE